MKNAGLNSLPKVEGHMLALTINLVVLGLFNAALGFIVSWSIGLLFPDYTEEWKKEPAWVQWSDVMAEISLLVVAAFWVTYLVRYIIPIVPLKPALEHYIEQYGSNFMFMYAIFIFFGDLSDKMIFLFQGEPKPSV
jgi:CBS domain containing-hemolysin-like protein